MLRCVFTVDSNSRGAVIGLWSRRMWSAPLFCTPLEPASNKLLIASLI